MDKRDEIRRDVAVLLMKYTLPEVLLIMAGVVEEIPTTILSNKLSAEVSRAIRKTIGELPHTFASMPILGAPSWIEDRWPEWVREACSIVLKSEIANASK